MTWREGTIANALYAFGPLVEYILGKGGAYMPLDVSYPHHLLESIFDDATPTAVCTNHEFRAGISEGCPFPLISLDEGWEAALAEENNNTTVPESLPLTLDNLAYTVYSSGTTGKPKGIQCPHRGAVFSYTWRHENYPYKDDGEDREACNVFYTWEMLRPILKGVPMYIIPDNVIYDPVLLCDFLKSNKITRMLFTPSLLEAVIDAGLNIQHAMKTMREILFCGEVVTTVLLDRCVKALPHVNFINLYSISESHDVAYGDLTKWIEHEGERIKDRKFSPVGKVLPGVQIAIMNEKLKPQPVGISGEIYIGGPTLARCYLNRPKLNEERFIKRPSHLDEKFGDRLYKSGDWGYMLVDGSLEICGRCDSMVKIRGYSVEVQAVEAALLDLPMVNTAVCLVEGDEGEDKLLIAYVVPEGSTSKKALRAALKRVLPFYMIPSYIVFLESLPILASSGKLDKKALPAVDKACETEIDAEGQPKTPLEKTLCTIWMDILKLKTIDTQESFFDLGGHSLLAARLLSKLNNEIGLEITVHDLFLHPTVSRLANLVESKQGKTTEELSESSLDLMNEVNLHDQAIVSHMIGTVRIDMQLRAFWRSVQYGHRWSKGRVLLTGVTGYLGAFLLKDLLLHSGTSVYCFIRDAPGVQAIDRLKESLARFNLLSTEGAAPTDEQQQLEGEVAKRVYIIKGDISLRNLGLTEEEFHYLSTEIDFVIHAAAYVNLIYPYQALHGPNVLGTQHVLIFACTSKMKPVHYISTDAVFPHGLKNCKESADMTGHHQKLEDGYSQTKWVAEQLVLRAKDRGLPVAIYRLGNLSGESEKAYWNPQDFNLRMLQTCANLGVAPVVDWKVEMTPVDFVSRCIVDLTQNIILGLGKIFHVINTSPIKSQWLFEWMNAHGYPLQMVPFSEWVNRVRDSKLGLIDGLIKDFARDDSFFARLSTYRNDNLQSVLAEMNKTYPEVSPSLLSIYFSNLTSRGVIQAPQATRNVSTNHHAPLNGKVAIVTGSSSGIGAGIAKGLARAGSKVALAARRVEMLEKTKLTIEQDGGMAIAVMADVTSREDMKELVRHTETSLGPVDILVNNAGVMYYTMMKNLKEDEWERQVDVNCKGAMNGVGAVLPGMLDRGSGHIVNITSDAGRKPFPGLAAYTGSKFFVEGFSQAMRMELKDTGIRVTCIQPGDVSTELMTHSTDNEAVESCSDSSGEKKLEPEDIANAVVYACSQPSYVAVNEILVEPRHAPA
ncbi:uncharacterized protein LOC135493708 isoform X2 [Lineus longissimus]|uniref:uncharacterized protein LOC135493708 isoform X2 n=1 Tax=Lineus longissimus TaxID=88925 RepID=UPI00315C7E4F